MTDLDKKLQEIAINNWPQFEALIGKNAIRAAKICMLRQENKSITQISIKLDIARRKAQYWCEECDVEKSAKIIFGTLKQMHKDKNSVPKNGTPSG